MSAYTDRVESSLRGLTAVSVGECPGCEQCADAHNMTPEEHDKAWHACEVDGESHFSWSPCGICGSRLGGDRHVWHALHADQVAARDAHRETARHMPIGRETREPEVEILHFDDACVDCVMYLANGEEPEEEE